MDEYQMTDYDNLIDHDMIAAAQSKLDAVTSRRGPAEATLVAARLAHSIAKAAMATAMAGDGGNAHDAAGAEEAAAKRLTVCSGAVPAIEAAILRADNDLRLATGVAHRPVMVAAVRKLVAACVAADVAREQLTLATGAFHSASAEMRDLAARGAGFSGESFGHGSPSLSRPDGLFVVPKLAEIVSRLEQPMGWWPGLGVRGNLVGEG